MSAAPRQLPTLRAVLARVHFRVTLFAVGMAGLTVLLAGFATIAGYAQQNLHLIAQSASYTVAPAVIFDDPDAARDSIAPLAAANGVAEITVVASRGGRELVRLGHGREERDMLGIDGLTERLVFPTIVTAPVVHRGVTIGEVRVRGDPTVVAGYIRSGLAGALACLVITAIATHFLASRLQQSVIGPLREIAAVAHSVREERSFGRRAPPAEIAEIDALGDDFNALLGELDKWHAHLRREHEELSHQARHDTLTDLPNRADFEHRLAVSLEQGLSDGEPFAILYLDGDGFKAVNDRYGHAAGDHVLVEIAARLKASVRAQDIAARLGGDEFAVLLPAPSGREAVTRICDSLAQRMAEPIALSSGEALVLGLSVGAAVFPEDGRDATALLEAADAGMYASKLARTQRS
ncbi:MAG: diguanylate cyclase [Sphingomonas sp.]|uniref:diguanylate cyclase domain-containing protein n=1 Tax=Sphingomonas sp. TaxID=28214 RepID=UPI003568F480